VTFVRVRAGLLEPKHVAAMGGSPLTLYLWLHTRVRFKGEGAGTTFPDQPYRHQDAADALGVPYGTVRRWLRALIAGGYVTTRPVDQSNGLELSITKYGEAPTPVQKRTAITNEDRPKMDRGVSTDGQGGVQKRPPSETPTRSAREKLTTRDSKRDTDTPLRGSAPPALQPHQALVNAWLEATGRDPAQARDYGRYVAVGAEMAARGDTPQDVGNCTRYLQSEPWLRERSKQPTLQQVRDALPLWAEQGRPATVRVGQNGAPKSAQSRIDAVFERAMHGNADRRRDAAVGDREAGRRVPPQLPG
jgi:hypothetical protein